MNLDALRTKLAQSDVRKAAKHGSLHIGQTLRGTLSLERTEKGMRLVVCGVDPVVLSDGSKADAVKALAPLYDIVVEG